MLQKIVILKQLVQSILHNYFIVQQNYFSDLYPIKILDLSVKSFLSILLCNYNKDLRCFTTIINDTAYKSSVEKVT